MSDYLQHIVGKRIYFDVNLFIYALEPTQNMHFYIPIQYFQKSTK